MDEQKKMTGCLSEFLSVHPFFVQKKKFVIK